MHRLHVPGFRIARVPITNAQYYLFAKATGYKTPDGWEDGRPPKELGSHPVVYVSFDDAMAYCVWLSEKTRPSSAAAQRSGVGEGGPGDRDQRAYPWGDEEPDANRCNFDMEHRRDDAGRHLSGGGKSVWLSGHERQCVGVDTQSV